MDSFLSPSLIEHPRSTHEIVGVLDHMLDDVKFAPPGTDQLRDALVQIAARYGEIVTQCLNASPDLHLEAFSELLRAQIVNIGHAMLNLRTQELLHNAKASSVRG